MLGETARISKAIDGAKLAGGAFWRLATFAQRVFLSNNLRLQCLVTVTRTSARRALGGSDILHQPLWILTGEDHEATTDVQLGGAPTASLTRAVIGDAIPLKTASTTTETTKLVLWTDHSTAAAK